jgi:hypothetical protein
MVLLVGLVAMGYVKTRQVVYQANGTVTLLMPPDQRTPNVFTAFNPGLIETAGLLARNASDGQTRAEFASRHLGSYTAVLTKSGNQWEPTFDTPTVDIIARDHDPDRAQRTFEAVVEHMSRTLARWQTERGVTEPRQINTSLTGATAAAVPLPLNDKRALAAVLLLIVGAEVIVIRRVRGRERRRRAMPSSVTAMQRSVAKSVTG